MTRALLAVAGLRHHWRLYLGSLLGAVIASAILVGALAVGDSVKESLRRMALSRLGETTVAVHAADRFFTLALAEAVGRELGAPAAAVTLLKGMASQPDGSARAPRVQVSGVDANFWKLGSTSNPLAGGSDRLALNERLARRLGAVVGGEVLLRIEKPSLLSRDAPLSTVEDAGVSVRGVVAAVLKDSDFGRFSLEANQIPPYAAFLDRETLNRAIDLKARANTLLVGTGSAGPPTLEAANAALWKHWRVADVSLEVRRVAATREIELRTDRVFLDEPVGTAAVGAAPGGRGILTYFVNGLRSGDRSTPYSTVASLNGSPLPAGMRDDEIAVNSWLAKDLGLTPGSQLTLDYYVVGPLRKLEERKATFRVHSVLPLAGAAADRDLMPDFPGVSESENCRDWKPGIPVELSRIRDTDEAYWDIHKGTPKAFITLAAGQKLWNNRFGNLTAVRYRPEETEANVEACVRQAVNPATVGLFFNPVREQALAAGAQSLDFGQLFIGFSFFLIGAALLLMSLLFALGIEQRCQEIGLLLAVGWTPRQVRILLLQEGAGIAALASAAGAVLGTLYTRGVVAGLGTVWSGAVSGSSLVYHAELATVVGGGVASFLVACGSIWLVVRGQAKTPARELMSSASDSMVAAPVRTTRRRIAAPVGLPTALISGVAGIGMALAGFVAPHEQAAGLFFGAGAGLLIAGIAVGRLLLSRLEQGGSARLSLRAMGARNISRRAGRSLSVVALLASGSFLVVAIGANRHDPADPEVARRRTSGTGGFTVYAESSLPIHQDLNQEDGRNAYGLDSEDLAGAAIAPFRVRPGDEASCLNLNRAQAPRLLGIDPRLLADRGAFSFAATHGNAENPWLLLDSDQPDGAIPVIGDENTLLWSLGKSVGDTLSVTDDRGDVLKLRVVGMVGNSVFQGSLLLSEKPFMQHFPSVSGYQGFLIDAPPDRVKQVTDVLSEALVDVGFDPMPAGERLALFAEVENTYLSIFAVLGGFGLLLGSAGLGVVVLRNVLERRSELALLRAVGFRSRTVQWLVFSEHSLLLAIGIAVGVGSALIAVLPSLTSMGAEVPVQTLSLTLLAVVAVGALSAAGATRAALSGSLMGSLRSE